MIDARNYKTIEELEEAMQLEYDICRLHHVRQTIARLKLNLTILECRYNEALGALH